MSEPPGGWLPADFVHPQRVPLPCGLHLRPIRATDVDLDLVAVRGSQQRLWDRYGPAWGWPPPTLTAEQDYEDLHHHEQEVERHESFNYALLDRAESALLGCVYLDPAPAGGPGTTDGHDTGDGAGTGDGHGTGAGEGVGVEVSWWVVDQLAGTPLEAELDAFVPAWLAARWPFQAVRFGFGSGAAPAAGRTFSFAEERTPVPGTDPESAEILWRHYRASTPSAPAAVPPVNAFGDSVELADELFGLVLRGVKRATASLPGDYGEGEPVPRPGDHWVVADGSGRAGLVLRTTEVSTGPLRGVTSAFAWDEGEGDRSREWWLAGHEAYWTRAYAARGEPLPPDLEVVFERFTVVWPPEAVARGEAFARSVAARPPGGLS